MEGVGPEGFEMLRNTTHSSPKAAVTECHTRGDLKQENFPFSQAQGLDIPDQGGRPPSEGSGREFFLASQAGGCWQSLLAVVPWPVGTSLQSVRLHMAFS